MRLRLRSLGIFRRRQQAPPCPDAARRRPRHADRAHEIEAELKKYGIRVKVDDRSEKIGYKIREAQLQKTPYMLVVGDKEVEDGTVSVRHRGEGDIGSMELSSLCDRLADEVKTKAIK